MYRALLIWSKTSHLRTLLGLAIDGYQRSTRTRWNQRDAFNNIRAFLTPNPDFHHNILSWRRYVECQAWSLGPPALAGQLPSMLIMRWVDLRSGGRNSLAAPKPATPVICSHES